MTFGFMACNLPVSLALFCQEDNKQFLQKFDVILSYHRANLFHEIPKLLFIVGAQSRPFSRYVSNPFSNLEITYNS